MEVLAPDGRAARRSGGGAAGGRSAAHTAVLVRVDGAPDALIEVGDVVRPGSYRAVDRLRRLGVRPVLATGDRRRPHGRSRTSSASRRSTPAARPRTRLNWYGLRAGDRVAVVGDGVNDAAALAGADLGIAMGTGTDVAIGAADVTLVRGDIEALADAVRLARHTLGTIRANLVWAFGYNAVTMPLAMVGLLNPMVAAAAMSLSSVLVVANSLRLRAWQPSPPEPHPMTGDPGARPPPATDTLLAALAPVAACGLALGGLSTWAAYGNAGSPARIAVTDGRVFLPSGDTRETAASSGSPTAGARPTGC